jgi:pantothenate kinase type III
MKALIVDAGNTRVTCAAWDGARQRPARVEGAGHSLAPPVPLRELGFLDHPVDLVGEKAFRDSFRKIYTEAGRPPVVLTSVVPRVAGMLPDGLDMEIVDHTSDLPFILGVSEPDQVGPDRLCNVAAAAAAGLSRALVVDAGTATTFDLLLDGVFVGGMIAPGMALAARKLGETASRLNPVAFGPVPWEVGSDTESAMAAGAWHTGTGGVRAVVKGILARYGDMPVIMTGGLGAHFEDSAWYFDPHWTLRGAAILSNR